MDLTPIEEGALEESGRVIRSEYLNSDSLHVRQAEFQALRYLDNNPRQVKRFDNAFRLQLHVASSTSSMDFNPDQLAAISKRVAMRLRWPRLALILDRYQDADSLREFLRDLEEAASISTDPSGGGQGVDVPRSLQSKGRSTLVEFEELVGERDRRALNELLAEVNPARRISSLPMAFLRVT